MAISSSEYWIGTVRGQTEMAIADLRRRPSPGCYRVVYIDKVSDGVFTDEQLGPNLVEQLSATELAYAFEAHERWQQRRHEQAAAERAEQQRKVLHAVEQAEQDRARLARLKSRAHDQYRRERAEAIARNHARYLTRAGFAPAKLFVPDPLRNPPRATVCWGCHAPLSSEIYDLACLRCGWIACLCGTCGCGHEKGVMDRHRLLQPAP